MERVSLTDSKDHSLPNAVATQVSWGFFDIFRLRPSVLHHQMKIISTSTWLPNFYASTVTCDRCTVVMSVTK